MSAQLNIEPLSNAIQRLDEGLHRYLQNKDDIQIRDGLVQRFEFTYELTHKTLKRFMALTGANPEDIAQMAFSDLIRTGNAQGLLSKDWADWKGFREMRGSTSHAYDERIALKVVAEIPAFLSEAKFFLQQLQSRLI
jgi:nucleotidyltransferase substrate binding protein (TIGR01987 family)